MCVCVCGGGRGGGGLYSTVRVKLYWFLRVFVMTLVFLQSGSAKVQSLCQLAM